MSISPNIEQAHYVLTDRAVLVAACMISGVGALVFNAFPLFLSVTANQFGLNDTQLGLLGTTYLGGFAVVALFAPIWMPRIEWRSIAVVAGVLILSALLVEILTDKVFVVYLAMAVVGVGASILYTIGLTILTRAVDTERAFGIKLMYEMAIAGLLMYVMLKVVIEKFGFTGFIVGTAILFLGSLLFVSRLPLNFMMREAKYNNSDEWDGAGSRHLAWASAAALFVQFAAFSAVWGFMERIGVDNGLAAETVGSILSLSILAGFVGALVAAVIGNKCGYVAPLTVGLVLSILAVAILATSKGQGPFVIGACVVNGMLQFSVVYQMGLLTHNDYSGKIAVMIPFILASGGAIGPGIAGVIVESSGLLRVYCGFALIAVLVIALSVWIGRKERA